jgi:hypothetical protein
MFEGKSHLFKKMDIAPALVFCAAKPIGFPTAPQLAGRVEFGARAKSG